MKKYIAIISMFAAGFVFADDENYDGKSVSEDFSGKSMNYSSWISANASGAKFVGTKLREANFSNATLSSGRTYADFSNADLRDSIFDNVILAQYLSYRYLSCIKLDGADIRGASFKNVVFSYSLSDYGSGAVGFQNANLTNVDFTGSTFCSSAHSSSSSSDFSGAIFKNTNFTSCILSYGGQNSYGNSISVDLSNRDVSSCIFDNAVLSSAYGTGYDANASSVSFANARVAGASFKGAILAYAHAYTSKSAVDFSNMDLSGCDFTGATLSAEYYSGESFGTSVSVKMNDTTLKNAKFDNAVLAASSKSGVDFSNSDLTGASFKNAKIKYDVINLTNAIIKDADFSNIDGNGLTTSQLSQTASYKNKDLSGVKFNGLNLTNWILRGQNLQNTSFAGANLTGVNARYADLRGSDLTGITGSLKTQNTIWTNGEIKNFTMESVDDSLTIRKYVPATSDGAMINAKIVDDASISGGAVLTLEQGAVLEIASGKTLSVLDNSEIIFNVDAAASDATKILLGENSKLVFGSDSKIIVNLDGVISPDDSYALSVIEVAADACISVADAISKDNLVLNVNGEAYDSDKWGFNFDPTTGALTINVNVPEPTTVAAIFGALALAFAAYRRRR